MDIVRFLVVALSVFVLLKGLVYFLKNFLPGKYAMVYQKFFPWLEAWVWVIFIYWSIDLFFGDQQYGDLIKGVFLIFVLLGFVWFVFRDYLAGVTVKSNFMLQPGMNIQMNEISGKIVSLGNFTLEVQERNGLKTRIPYTAVYGKSLITRPGKKQGKSQIIVLEIPQKYGANNILQTLRRRLLEFPWVIPGEDISIELTPQDDFYKTIIEFISIQEDMLSKTEEHLRNYCDQHFPHH